MAKDTSITETVQVPPKKAYEKPSFRYEKVFVTSALSCGKVSQSGGCGLQLRVS